MITLHYLENSVSIRILWLLEEIGVDFKLERYNRDKNTKLATDEYRKLHPAGTAPVLVDGDICLAETNAIAQYLLEKYKNNLVPDKYSENFSDYLYWFHASQGSFAPLTLMKGINYALGLQSTKEENKKIAEEIFGKINTFFIDPRLQRLLKFMDDTLGEKKYLAGDNFSVADIMMVQNVEMYGDYKNYANIVGYVEKIKKRKAYKATIDKVGNMNLRNT